MLNLTPVKDTREEEEVPADYPVIAMEKIKVNKDGEKHITETDLYIKKVDYPYPQKCCSVILSLKAKISFHSTL